MRVINIYQKPLMLLNWNSKALFTNKILFSFVRVAKKKQPFLSESPSKKHDLIFIRHAESIFNLACQTYRKKHKIPYVWKELCNHEGFDHSVLYNPDFIDCSITEQGKKECKKTKSLLNKTDVDCILVSPLLRALQTCQIVFEKHTAPIYVQPLLTGPLRSVSDVSGYISLKKILYPRYNFQATDGQDPLWFLQYISEEQQKICSDRFAEKGIYDITQKKKEVVAMLKENKLYEDALRYRKRVQEMKNLLQKYRQRYKKIAVVTHFYAIQYISAMDYQESGVPKYYMDIKNCTPYYASLTDLLSVKEQL